MGDRRKRKRVPLHWPVRLLRREGQLVESITENLSSEGLYCITKERFKRGEMRGYDSGGEFRLL